jgi:hypothetical protein
MDGMRFVTLLVTHSITRFVTCFVTKDSCLVRSRVVSNRILWNLAITPDTRACALAQ